MKPKLLVVENVEVRACACDVGAGRVAYKNGCGECDHCGLLHRLVDSLPVQQGSGEVEL
jgi:hypothetical protein